MTSSKYSVGQTFSFVGNDNIRAVILENKHPIYLLRFSLFDNSDRPWILDWKYESINKHLIPLTKPISLDKGLFEI